MQKKLRTVYLFFFFLGIYLIFMVGTPTIDSYSSYMTARSIVEFGTLELMDTISIDDPNLSHRGGAAIYGIYHDGKYYSKYGIGWAVLMIPFYLFSKFLSLIMPQINQEYISLFTVCTSGPLLTALLLSCLYWIYLKSAISEKTALFAVLICGMTTIIPFYSRGPNVETLDSLILLMLVFHIYSFSQDGREKRLFYSGLLTALLMTTKIYNIILLLPLNIWILFILFRKQNHSFIHLFKKYLFMAGIPVLICIGFLLFLNYVRFGSFLSSGYDREIEIYKGAFNISRIPEGLYGFLLSPGKSIFLFNPILIMIFFSLKSIAKKNGCLFFGVGIIFLTYLFFLSSYCAWNSGPWGTRYLMPTLPMVMLFLPVVLEITNGRFVRWKKASLVFLTSLGLIVNLPSMIIDVDKWLLIGKNTGAFSATDTSFKPQLSQIFGAWRLVTSSVEKSVTDNSAHLNGTDIGVDFQKLNSERADNKISLTSYDDSDIWFLRIFKGSVTKYDGNVAIIPADRMLRILSIVIVICLVFLILLSGFLYRKSLMSKNNITRMPPYA